MRADEAIRMIERAAVHIPVPDLAVFSQRARRDLGLYRAEPHRPPHKEPPSAELRYPEPSPAFSVPRKYAEAAELWIVYSSFCTCFLDPIVCGEYVLGAFPKLCGDAEIKHIVFATTADDDADPEEMDTVDQKRLSRDVREMFHLGAQIGRAMFGEHFKIGDFIGEAMHDE